MIITINKYNLKGKRLLIESSSEVGIDASVDIDMTNLSFFIGKVNSYIMDMFYLSAIVYGIDRAFDRYTYSLDGWSRKFDVTVKLENSELFSANADIINSMLSFLTGDFWNITYDYVDRFELEGTDIPELSEDFEQVNLFSGGMDSFIGAIDFLAGSHTSKLCLTSHYDKKMPGAKEDQENSIQALDLYKNDFFHMPSVAIFPNTSREKTCRSRSFIFISMAALVAVYKNINIVVPENGSVSLNFPLSPSRRAACSTRTTHVLFINKLKGVYDALGQHVEIYNPYETKTKGQMVHNCNNRRLLLNTLDNTNSCGKRNAKQHMSDPSASHCGRCMPCMYRRASLVGLKDSTTYGDTFRQLYNDKGRRSDDFFAMLNYLRIDLTEDDIRKELRIAGLGLLPNIEEYVQLVKDTRAELKKMVSSAQDCDEVKRYLGLI